MALKAFRESLAGSGLSPVNMSMMNCLCALFATHGVISKAGEFMTVGWFVRDFCIHVFNFVGYHLIDGWEW